MFAMTSHSGTVICLVLVVLEGLGVSAAQQRRV
jgi:hypothetical protein